MWAQQWIAEFERQVSKSINHMIKQQQLGIYQLVPHSKIDFSIVFLQTFFKPCIILDMYPKIFVMHVWIILHLTVAWNSIMIATYPPFDLSKKWAHWHIE